MTIRIYDDETRQARTVDPATVTALIAAYFDYQPQDDHAVTPIELIEHAIRQYIASVDQRRA